MNIIFSDTPGKISMWREPNSMIKTGGKGSLIVDRGSLTKAVRSSNGDYLFSEAGSGLKPLVLIGTLAEIANFMLENSHRGIENHIKKLPEIYMGITHYMPQQRFSALFPLQDSLKLFFDQATALLPLPGNNITDVGGAISQIAGYTRDTRQALSGDDGMKNIFYLKFSYLCENGMQRIGIRTISFGTALQRIQNGM